MKAQAFKNLIKEAVREVIREEMSGGDTQPLKENKSFNFSSNDVMTGGLPVDARNSLRTKMGMAFGFEQPQQKQAISTIEPQTQTGGNPYLSFIADSAANMTAQDIAGLKNLG